MRCATLFCAAALTAAAIGATTPPPAADDPRLAEFYQQKIGWGPCPASYPASMQCGKLKVPLDYADPAQGTIELALARIPVTGSARLGSLVLNYGGPGESGADGTAERFDRWRDLAKSYDVVGFDPRGIAKSAPISCGGALPLVGTEYLDASELLRATKRAARACESHTGPILHHVGTVDVTRDMDVLRAALGDPKLNYWGGSYGSRIGAVYAAQFPQRAGRMILDGVDTLDKPLAELAMDVVKGQQLAFEGFARWCTKQPTCVYTGRDPRKVVERVEGLVAQLDKAPLTAKGGKKFNGQTLAFAIENSLYGTRSWPELADGLGRLERDEDLTVLAELAEPETDNEGAALTVVNCSDITDRGVRGDAKALQRKLDALLPKFQKASPIFGRGELWEIELCHGQPPGDGFAAKINHPGAPPMLLVGVRNDPATPYRWSEETASRLGSAMVVDYEGQGHTGYVHSLCVKQHVDRFLVTGQLPDGNTICPAEEVNANGE
ncbi:alpha/beta hydrolase [Streptomyces sp. AcE210]|uniref:alpha/beta hydrolase n=1 Tax=Streptomyces sp. AcE210 TaxID=2292703 RepID=UPI000E305E82|nr:alpha/beta hydrolase [Streptomyces sp. AcE210]RFC70680.1 alpha/beta hydrolase [Streptomyces sp. AcE210]